MKRCFKCGQLKAIDMFYRHKAMKDGHLNKCIECAKSDVRAHRRECDSVRAYDRARSKTEARRAQISKTSKLWRSRHPEKYKAQTAVGNAVRDGKIVKKPCSICGDKKSHAHHEDYSKPLSVIWFCAKHHQRHHHRREK